MSKVTIKGLALENVKRVKAFALEPSDQGLTIIGGKNRNGKTSVLDAIAWGLGGSKYAPSQPQREGAMNPPQLQITLSNGLVVERKGKNAALTVTDPTGKRHGQALLDSFVSQFALDLPKFMAANDRDKAQILLQTLGIGEQLAQLEQQEKTLYNQRHAIGQVADAKAKHAAELPEFADAPAEPVSVSELIQQQQAILAKNGENQRLRQQKATLESTLAGCQSRIAELEAQLATLRQQEASVISDLATASKSVEQLQDESTAEIELSLANIETINAHVAANEAKGKAAEEAADYKRQYDDYTAKIEQARADRMALLDGADLPLPELTVEESVLLYRGKAWDCMSGSEQLQVATAIVSRLNPDCGFVIMDKLEQFDLDTLKEFGQWLIDNKLQAIATRVSTGEECTIVIEDGLPAGKTYIETVTPLPAPAEPVAVAQPETGNNGWGEW